MSAPPPRNDSFSTKALGQWEEYSKVLDKDLSQYPRFVMLSQLAGLRPSQTLAAIVGFFCVSVLIGFGQNPLAHLVGFTYPMYASFKAVESPDPGDDTQWLTYWIVYGGFTVAEAFTDILFQYIPFYYFVKIIFLIWCFLPSTKGARTIYFTLFRPVLSRYQTRIDRKIAQVIQLDIFGPAAANQAELQKVVNDTAHAQAIVKATDAALPVVGSLPPDGNYQFVIQMFRANNMAARDRSGSSDPYFILYWEGDTDERAQFKSSIKNQTLNPEWNAVIVFPWKGPAKKNLIVDFWDHDTVGKDEFLGRCVVETKSMTNVQTAYKLQPRPNSEDSREFKIPDGCCAIMSFVSTKVEVSLLKGKSLRKADMGGKSDPFCRLYWQDDGDKSAKQSSVKPDTLNPEWGEKFVFDWGPPLKTKFVVDTWDKDRLSDDFLGRAVIDASQFSQMEKFFDLAPRPEFGDDANLGISGSIGLSFRRLGLPI